jgi:hypothetical protein
LRFYGTLFRSNNSGGVNKRQEVTKAVAPVTCKKYAESFMKRINLCISLKGANAGY